MDSGAETLSPEFCFLVCLGRAVSRHRQNRVGLEETKGPLSVPSKVERSTQSHGRQQEKNWTGLPWWGSG